MTYLRGILLSTVFSVASPFFLSEKANAVPPNQGDEAPVLSRASPVPSGPRDNAMNDAAVLLASMGSSNDRSEASQASRAAPVLRGMARALALCERGVFHLRLGHDSQALQDCEESLGMKDA